MPKTTKEKKKPRRPKVILYKLPGKGNIDPRVIRKAVVTVYNRMLREEAEAAAQGESKRLRPAEAQ